MWSKLEVLYHIVKAGTILDAAKALRTDQPGLTRQLAALENKLGFKLVNRSTDHRLVSLATLFQFIS